MEVSLPGVKREEEAPENQRSGGPNGASEDEATVDIVIKRLANA